ncbi:MAG: hypothetical protein COA37_09165 [Hoeflea sp.]|nr:MAG: hypothetical protein COA37_09165 [Hoeflea sp.]
MSDSAVLTLNAGSSSLKFAIFSNVERPRRLWSGAIERIGLPGARFRLSDARGAVFREETGTIADHDTALKRLLLAIEHEASGVKLVAVGHRIAHGGPDCDLGWGRPFGVYRRHRCQCAAGSGRDLRPPRLSRH